MESVNSIEEATKKIQEIHVLVSTRIDKAIEHLTRAGELGKDGSLEFIPLLKDAEHEMDQVRSHIIAFVMMQDAATEESNPLRGYL